MGIATTSLRTGFAMTPYKKIFQKTCHSEERSDVGIPYGFWEGSIE